MGKTRWKIAGKYLPRVTCRPLKMFGIKLSVPRPMPEGPEVRRYADLLHETLSNQPLCAMMARTKQAKAWLLEFPDALLGPRVSRVWARGKNLLIEFESGVFCYSHLMMWGRWQIVPNEGDLPFDRRERARLTTRTHHAILFSAPVFEIHRGDAHSFQRIIELGPETLPYAGESFDSAEFVRRLQRPENASREIGAILLDQGVLAGIGNYLRAEILFLCRIDPFRHAETLQPVELENLCTTIPRVVRHAYESGGATAPDEQRQRMREDATLVYNLGREFGARHYVFRRTNLPCLICGSTIRQLRQTTRVAEIDSDQEDKTRIIYFCPSCQNVALPEKPPKDRKSRVQSKHTETL